MINSFTEIRMLATCFGRTPADKSGTIGHGNLNQLALKFKL